MRNLRTKVLWEVVQGNIEKAEQYRHIFGDVISLSKFSGCSQQLKTEVPDKESLTRKRKLKHELANQLDGVIKPKVFSMNGEYRSRLIGLIEDEGRNGVTLSDVLEAKILSPFSIQALSLNLVSYPPKVCPEKQQIGVFPEILLAEKNFIVLPPGHRPGSLIGTEDADESPPMASESRIIDDEMKTGKPDMWWARWWLSLLGFKDTGGRYVRAYVRT